MARHIVVSASPNYGVALKALLNSWWYWHGPNGVQWHIMTYKDVPFDLPDPRMKHVEVSLPTDISAPMACKIHRFKYASHLNAYDDAVVILDADMFFCANIDWWWPIIEGGYLLYGSNGSNIQYTPAHEEKYGIPNLAGLFNWKTVTSVPAGGMPAVFGKLWRQIYDHRTDASKPKQGADFELVNAYLTGWEWLDAVVTLSPAQVTNIHHYQQKPNTRVMRKGDSRLYTEDGLEVCMSHGRWYSPGYVENLMKPMMRYCGENKKCVQGAVMARQYLLEEFECARDYKYKERYPWRLLGWESDST